MSMHAQKQGPPHFFAPTVAFQVRPWKGSAGIDMLRKNR